MSQQMALKQIPVLTINDFQIFQSSEDNLWKVTFLEILTTLRYYRKIHIAENVLPDGSVSIGKVYHFMSLTHLKNGDFTISEPIDTFSRGTVQPSKHLLKMFTVYRYYYFGT